MEEISKKLSPLNQVAVHLAICSVLSKPEIISATTDRNFWEIFSSKLFIYKLNGDECRKLYEEVSTLKDGVRYSFSAFGV